MNCTPCAFGCLTCEISDNRCTSCPNGRYLNANYKCELCETFWKNDMIVGSSGACLETCGDGKNYGMHMCDDGNLKNGDGCSSSCL
jgi:cysteine-rich repeat protein